MKSDDGGPAPSAHAAKDAACRFFGKLEDFKRACLNKKETCKDKKSYHRL